MRTYDIVGYVYEAAVHCENCTAKRFPSLKGTDREGNEVAPCTVSDAMDADSSTYCDTCHVELYEYESNLEAFIAAYGSSMFFELQEIVARLKGYIAANPDEYLEHGTDTASIDVRLCVDIDDSGGTYVYRTGSVDYDQRHSQYCAASCVTLDTDARKLFNELLEQLTD